jgi:hypothetical protein
MDEDVQLWLHNMDSATVDGIHSVFGNIHPNDMDFAGGEERGSWQSDVAKADHGNGLKHVGIGMCWKIDKKRGGGLRF